MTAIPPSEADELNALRARVAELGGIEAEHRQMVLGLHERIGDYRSLFEDSPISLWLEDFSAVRAYLEELRAQGVTDLRAYFLAHHPAAIAHCVSLVQVMDVNHATLDVFRASRKADLLGSLDRSFAEESLPVFLDEILAFAAGKTVFECEVVGQPLRGEPINCLVQVAIAPGHEETWAKVFVSVIDITARKRVEAALRLNEARLQTLWEISQMTDASAEAIADFALDRAVSLTSSQYGFLAFLDDDETVARIYAWSEAARDDCQVSERPDEYRIPEMGIWGEVVRQRQVLMLNDFAASHPLKQGFPDGHVQLKRYLSVPVFDQERVTAIIGVGNKVQPYDEADVRQLRLLMAGMWDVIRRRREEEALRLRSEQLADVVQQRTYELQMTQERLLRQERLAVLGQLAGSVGHELRNPLSVINHAVYFLRLILEDGDDKVREYLDILDAEVENAEAIISDLLDFSRSRPPQMDAVKLADLLDQVLAAHPVPTGVSVVMVFPPDLPELLVDSRQIGQVFANLLDNAYQAMPEGGQVTVSAQVVGKMVRLDFSDTGVGILPENLGRAFEPLFTTRSQGIGLGLAVSQRMVENNGGTISVQSLPGEGATFTLTLPYCVPVPR
ncbi:MAG: GAF domain-containing protein [Anaerolineae bacterium]|nr:GAF domain-containing protein [Anaerolineae bacterium]